jgi:hypothetical protein
MTEIYVVWNMKNDSVEGLCYVSSDLADVRKYEQEYGWIGTRYGEDRRVCRLVPVDQSELPILDELRPHRIVCPSCQFAEYVGFNGISYFRALGPATEGSIEVVCPQCSTHSRVTLVLG